VSVGFMRFDVAPLSAKFEPIHDPELDALMKSEAPKSVSVEIKFQKIQIDLVQAPRGKLRETILANGEYNRSLLSHPARNSALQLAQIQAAGESDESQD